MNGTLPPLLMADAEGRVIFANDAAAVGLPVESGRLLWENFSAGEQAVFLSRRGRGGVLAWRRAGAEVLLFFDSLPRPEGMLTVLIGEPPDNAEERAEISAALLLELSSRLSSAPDFGADDALCRLFTRYRIVSDALSRRVRDDAGHRVYVQELVEAVGAEYAAVTGSGRPPCTVAYLPPLQSAVELATDPADFSAFLMLAFSVFARGVVGRARDPEMSLRFFRDRDLMHMILSAEMTETAFSAQGNRSFAALARLLPEQGNEIVLLSRAVSAAQASMTFDTFPGEDEQFRLSFSFSGGHPGAGFKAPSLTARERGVIRVLSEFLV